MGASILRLPDVIKKTALSRSAIYGMIAKGLFPKQIKLTARSSGWIQSEVDQWVDDRVAERDSEVA
jgi:prophage regulatory protein